MQSSYIKKERLFVSIFLLLIFLVLTQAVHNAWFILAATMQEHPPAPGTPYTPLFEYEAHIPNAYRVAVPALAHLVMKIFHINDKAWVAACFDGFSGFVACYLFYRLAVDSFPETQALASRRLLVAFLFLAIIQFPIAWVIPWARPETLPTALYLSVSLFSLHRIKQNRLWIAAVIAATVIQGFVRSDVPLILGISIVLISLLPATVQTLGSRRLICSLGGSVLLISCAIQGYLQRIRFRGLDRWPGGMPVITLGINLHSPHSLATCSLALLPFLLFSAFLVAKRPTLGAEDILILIASALYLPLWFTAGVVAEVRVFVPFMFAMSVSAAKVLASFMSEPRTLDEYRRDELYRPERVKEIKVHASV